MSYRQCISLYFFIDSVSPYLSPQTSDSGWFCRRSVSSADRVRVSVLDDADPPSLALFVRVDPSVVADSAVERCDLVSPPRASRRPARDGAAGVASIPASAAAGSNAGSDGVDIAFT